MKPIIITKEGTAYPVGYITHYHGDSQQHDENGIHTGYFVELPDDGELPKEMFPELYKVIADAYGQASTPDNFKVPKASWCP